MLECIFTIDYEIYGNGEGSLRDLVYEPMARLMEIFESHQKKLVVFTEVAEFEIIEQHKTDPAIDEVKEQLRELYEKGFEIGLHLHPQWYNAKNANGKWIMVDNGGMFKPDPKALKVGGKYENRKSSL